MSDDAESQVAASAQSAAVIRVSRQAAGGGIRPRVDGSRRSTSAGRTGVRGRPQHLRPHRLLLAIVGLLLLAIAGPQTARAQDWDVTDGQREQKILERLVKILEGDPFNDYAFQQLRKRAAAGGELDAIIQRFADTVAAEPGNVEALVLLARLHQAASEAEIGLGYARAAREASAATDPRVYVLEGQLLSELGRSGEAAEAFELALSNTTSKREKAEILRELGAMAHREGRTDDAVEAYLAIVELQPNDTFLRWELGSLFFELERWPEALEQYQAAADLAGRNVEERSRAELEVAAVFEKQGRWADAIAIYEEIMRRARSTNWLHIEARTRMVDAFRRADDLGGLLSRLDAILKRSPRDGFALATRAQVLQELGRTEEALAAYETLIEKAPEADPDAVRHWLRLVRQTRPRTEVIAAWKQVIEATRDPDDSLTLGIDLARYLRDTSDAPLDAYAWLLEVEVDHRPGKNASDDELARLERIARAYLELGAYDDARARAEVVYASVLEADPERLPVFLALLEMAAERGESEREAELLETIFDSPAFGPDVMTTLVEFYTGLGNTSRVTQLVTRARQRFPDEVEYRFLEAQDISQAAQPSTTLRRWRELMMVTDDDHHLRTASQAYTQLLDDLGMLDSTISETEREWARQPDDWRVARVLFYLYAYGGRLEDALGVLTTISALAPNGALGLEDHAFSLLQQSNPEDALQLLNALARRRPLMAWSYRLQAAAMLMARGRGDVVPTLIERALEDAADNPDALATAGELWQRLGDPLEAETLLAEAVRLAPRSAAHRAAYANVLLESASTSGDTQRAERAYHMAVEGLSVALDPMVVDDLLTTANSASGLAGISAGQMVEDLRARADLALNADVAAQIREVAQRIAVPLR